MEYDTKTRKSASVFHLQAVASAFAAYQYSAIWIALRSTFVMERMLMFACYVTYSPVAHGGQKLFRVLLRSGQMAHNHGMTPSATRLLMKKLSFVAKQEYALM